MPLVEIIRGIATSDKASSNLTVKTQIYRLSCLVLLP